MSKFPDLYEAAVALLDELQRQLDNNQMDFEPDFPGEMPMPETDGEKRARISQCLIAINSVEAGDLRRAIARHRRITRKLTPKAA